VLIPTLIRFPFLKFLARYSRDELLPRGARNRRWRGGEFDRTLVRYQFRRARQTIEEIEAGEIFVVERIVDIFAQVGFERARWQIEFERGALGDVRDVR
jgi:hypothetical protein